MQPDRNAIETVRRHFYESGTTVTDWARERGFDRSLVYSVLNGRCLARRGESHRIAVALGLKPAGAERRADDAVEPASAVQPSAAIPRAQEVVMKT